MRSTIIVLFSAVLLSVVGCTVGTPQLSSLSEFSGITFSSEKKLTQTYTIGTLPTCTSELTISGQCDQRFNQLQFSIDGETTWTNISGYNATSDGDCVDNEFKLYFPNICQTFEITSGSSETKKLQIRGDKKMPQNVTREVTVYFTKEDIQPAKISVNSPAAINEGDSVDFIISLETPATSTVTVNYALTLGTASTTDFSQLNNGTLTFNTGDTQKTVTISTLDNSMVCEISKSFYLDLSNPSSNATIVTSRGTSTIADPDRPILSIVDLFPSNPYDASVTEGSIGNIKVGLSQVCPTHNVTFSWNTINGTATVADSDYTGVTATLTTIVKGSDHIFLQISTTQDSTVEPDETISVAISAPVEASIGTATGILKIINDDNVPMVSINSPTAVTEGGSITFTITLDQPAPGPISVDYSPSNVTTSASDFAAGLPVGSTVFFAYGETSKTVTISTLDDSIYEPSQTFSITIQNPINAILKPGESTGIGTIGENDSKPVVTFQTGPTVNEGSIAEIVVQLSHQSEESIAVDYATQDVTAEAGPSNDYSAQAGSINIPPLTISNSVYITTYDDSIDEPSQQFRLSLLTATNATIGGLNTAVATLQDNDAEPSFSIASTSATEDNTLPFTVTLSAVSQQTFTVDFASTDGTAISAVDYAPTGGTLTFSPNQTVNTINVSTISDIIIEPNETFSITLSNSINITATGASGTPTITTAVATGTINDNDTLAPPVSISLAFPATLNPTSIVAAPKFLISGVDSGDTVTIYQDNCVTPFGSTIVISSSGTTNVTSYANISNGTYVYKTDRINSSGTRSSCSTAFFSYDYQRPLVEPLYGGISNWNSYYQYLNGSQDEFNQSGSVCDGSEFGLYGEVGGCVHGGEKRKVVAYGFDSCSNLYITDANNFFDWFCGINISGQVVFYSKGLKSGYGLRDLISITPVNWKPNSVSIDYWGISTNSSLSTAWWSNPIVDLATDGNFNNSNSQTMKSLSTEGNVYVAPVDVTTYGYIINANKVSLVTLGSAKLKKYGPNSTGNCGTSGGTGTAYLSVICGSMSANNWLEVNIDGVSGTTVGASYGVYISNWRMSRITKTTVSPLATASLSYALKLSNSNYNYIDSVDLHSISSGLDLTASVGNKIKKLNVSYAHAVNSNTTSLNLLNSYSNLFSDIRISNQNSGFANSSAMRLSGAGNNSFSRVTIMNIYGNLTSGINLSSLNNDNIFGQLLISNTWDAAISFDGSNTGNVITQATLLNNRYNGIYFSNGNYNNNSIISTVIGNQEKGIQTNSSFVTGNGNKLKDTFIAHSTNWALEIPYSMLFTTSGYFIHGNESSCAGSAGDSVSICTDASQNSGGYLGSAFVGIVGSDDAANPDDNFGFFSSSLSNLTLGGSLFFENAMRGWGRNDAFPNTNLRGAADSTLRIWDFTPAVGDQLYNRSYYGITANSAILNLDSATCVAGTVSATDNILAPSATFLRNAIEISEDKIGNDNFLCEANEECFYAPNIGAYQGKGTLSSGYCTVGDSTGPGLDGIIIRKYTTN